MPVAGPVQATENAMQRIRAPLGVLQGNQVLFSDFANGGVMWTGEGEREARVEIRFGQSFVAAPAVMVALSMWDMDRRSNARGDLTAENITAEGFEMVFRTWGDTRIARLRASWMAMGPLHDDDHWDVD